MTDDISMFKSLIRQRYGLTLAGVDDRRLGSILAGIPSPADDTNISLCRRLEKSPEILDDLVSQLTVNETYFFRDPGQIGLVVDRVIPRLRALRGTGHRLRLLSAGCSSGEEPYSLAIALTERWGQQTPATFAIDACDLDRQILQKAARGLYANFSFRGVDQDLRARYFEPVGQRYLLAPEIRRLVHFFELNLLAASYPDHLPGYDLIFFRNVSIYFDTPTRLTILTKLAHMLADDGILIVASSETLANDLGVFTLVEEEGHYYFVKGHELLPSPPLSAPDPAPAFALPPTPRPPDVDIPRKPGLDIISTPPSGRSETIEAPALMPTDIRELILQEETEQAAYKLQQLLARRDTTAHEVDQARLLSAWMAGNHKDFRKARELVQKVLTHQSWNPDALVLEGLLERWQGHYQEAIAPLKKAVYSCPECWPAWYYLAESHRALQQPEAALRSYQRVRRLLSTQPQTGTGLDILPLPLAAADALFLSEHQLLRMNRQALA